MTTFVLKKYEENKTVDSPNNDKDENTNIEEKEITIKVEGSVAEIVANALNKVLENKVTITEITEDNDASDNVKAVSTEDINSDPLKLFKSINKNDLVYIQNTGFKTSQEEWFLTNIPNKTSNVFYTVESLVKFITNKLGV